MKNNIRDEEGRKEGRRREGVKVDDTYYMNE